MFTAATLFPDTAIAGESSATSAQPNTITGLQLWLKADAITGLNDGDAVGTWTDSSSSGLNYTQATESKKPLYKTGILNSKPVVRFDGTNDWLSNSTLLANTSGSAATMFIVSKLSSGTNKTIFSTWPNPPNNGWDAQYLSTTSFEYFHPAQTPNSSTTFTNAFHIIEIRRNGLAIEIGSDGTLAAPVTISAFTASTGTGTFLGSINGTSNFLDGDIAEIIFYNTNLSDANRALVENYLADKYAIAVISNNNRKIFDAIQSSTTNTTCAFGTTATQRYIIAKPGVSNSTSATPAAAQDVGFNILRTDMNNTTGTPNKRKILTGTWTFHCVLQFSTADTSSVFSIKAYVHRRSASGVLTELFNAESATLVGVQANVTWTKTSVAQQLFDTDETLHIEYWIQGRGGGTTGIVAQTVTLNTGPTTLFQNVDFVLPSGILTDYQRAIDTTCTGTALLKREVGVIRATSSQGTVTLRRSVGIIRTANAQGVPTLKRALAKTLSVTAQGVPLIIKTIGKAAFQAEATGVASLTRSIGIVRTATAQGTASIARAIGKTFIAMATGVGLLQRNIAFHPFETTATGIASGTLAVPLDQPINGGGGGSTGGETSSTFIK